MTTTEHAATIRATLKRDHKWTSRQVSVRAKYFSMGSSIDVTVNDPAIPLPIVKAISEKAEHVDRCQITGEILSGGNTYVSVRYSREAQAIHGRRYADAVQRAVNTVEPGSNVLEPVAGTNFLIGRPHKHTVSLWDKDSAGCLQSYGDVESIAQTIGALIGRARWGITMIAHRLVGRWRLTASGHVVTVLHVDREAHRGTVARVSLGSGQVMMRARDLDTIRATGGMPYVGR